MSRSNTERPATRVYATTTRTPRTARNVGATTWGSPLFAINVNTFVFGSVRKPVTVPRNLLQDLVSLADADVDSLSDTASAADDGVPAVGGAFSGDEASTSNAYSGDGTSTSDGVLLSDDNSAWDLYFSQDGVEESLRHLEDSFNRRPGANVAKPLAPVPEHTATLPEEELVQIAMALSCADVSHVKPLPAQHHSQLPASILAVPQILLNTGLAISSFTIRKLASDPRHSMELAIIAANDGSCLANIGALHPWFVRDIGARNDIGRVLVECGFALVRSSQIHHSVI